MRELANLFAIALVLIGAGGLALVGGLLWLCWVWWRRSIHVHTWIGTAWNPWMVEHEQRCSSCGAYRHRYIDPSPTVPQDWRPGPYPKAEAIRVLPPSP